MTTKTKNNERRSIEVIEKELENVKAAQASITDELASLAGKLDQAVSEEARTFSEATRAGKTPKASPMVAKLEQRRRELERQAAVVEPDRLKLEAEKLTRLLEQVQAEEREKNAAAEKALNAQRRAEARVNETQTEASMARQHRIALIEQRRDLRKRLAAMGHTDPAELAEHRRNEEEAEQFRQQMAEHAKAVNRQGMAEAGFVPTEAITQDLREGRARIIARGQLRGEEQ
jgi:hypothetical protein